MPSLIPPVETDPARLPPVTIVSGFLGAGKTTLLTRLVSAPHGLRVALVVNDVGALNLDAALLREALPGHAVASAARMIELTNGCVCCSVRDQLAETVAELAASGRYDHIVVECSGVATPRPVADLFLRPNEFGRTLGEFARLHALVTVVDAARFLAGWRQPADTPPASDGNRSPSPARSLSPVRIRPPSLSPDHSPAPELARRPGTQAGERAGERERERPQSGEREREEEREKVVADTPPASDAAGGDTPVFQLMVEQAECADVIVVNKTDLVSAGELATVTALLAGLNPRAEIHPAREARLGPGFWPGASRFDPQVSLKSAAWIQNLNTLGEANLRRRTARTAPVVTSASGSTPASPRSAGAGDHAARFGIMTCLYTRRRPLSADAVCALIGRDGIPGLLRAKGFFWAKEKNDEMAFLSAAGRIARIEYLRPWAATLVERGQITEEKLPATIRALWEPPHGDRRQELVFIGVHLDQQALDAALDACA
ncbi:putative GTPase, G3E family [Opitutaceae bacterium TAV1]|nr:putative GTPase, G3E family [Opitutaceae bacterium TAV1]